MEFIKGSCQSNKMTIQIKNAEINHQPFLIKVQSYKSETLTTGIVRGRKKQVSEISLIYGSEPHNVASPGTSHCGIWPPRFSS